MYLFYVACGSAQGGYAIRAGADSLPSASCLPCFCHKLLANMNGVTESSLSRLLRKPLENQKGTHMLLDRCQQVTNRNTKWEKHTNTQCAPWLKPYVGNFNRAVSIVKDHP